MKVLITTAYYEPATGLGGPVQAIGSMIDGLRAAGAEAVVLTTDADGIVPRCVPRPGWQTRNGVRVHYSRCRGLSKPSPVGRFFFAPALLLQLAALVPGFDLLHLQGPWVFPTLAGSRIALLFDKPYVISAHGMLFPWALRHKSLKKRVYLGLFERRSLRGAARVHFTTSLEERQTRGVLRDLPSVVIPNPVAPAPAHADGASFRRSIGVGGAAPLVVFLGRIHAVKGLELLVEAATEVVREAPGTVFALVGNDEGGYATVVRDMIARRGLDRVVLLPGPVRGGEKWSVYSAADVFVLPSHQENFGMAAAEAMAAGVPVVTSNLVGVAEDIRESGAGLVVERTARDFGRAILALLGDAALRRRMGRAGRDLAGRKYSPEAVARDMLRMYGEVVEEHSRQPVRWSARASRAVCGWHRQKGVG